MANLCSEALVLRNRRFSESSLIAVLLSRAHGRLDVLAKGCRRDKSPLFGHLDLYQREEVMVLQRSQAGLDLLIEAAFIDEHAGLRFSPPALAAAGLLAEVAMHSCLPGEPHPELYDVMAGAFHVLSGLGEAAAKAGLARSTGFAAEEKALLIGRTVRLALQDMLTWLGFRLELGRCVICGSTDPEAGGNALSKRHGGRICRTCRPQHGGSPIGPNALAALMERGAGAEDAEIRLTPRERRGLLVFLVDYSQYVIEKPFHSRDVLFQLLRC